MKLTAFGKLFLFIIIVGVVGFIAYRRYGDQLKGWAGAGGDTKPQQVIEEINRQTNGEAIITTGVGQHQMWAAQFYRWRRPRQMITSGGLGTMGYGLPAAIGAQLGSPGKIVIDIDGDASYLMTC